MNTKADYERRLEMLGAETARVDSYIKRIRANVPTLRSSLLWWEGVAEGLHWSLRTMKLGGLSDHVISQGELPYDDRA